MHSILCHVSRTALSLEETNTYFTQGENCVTVLLTIHLGKYPSLWFIFPFFYLHHWSFLTTGVKSALWGCTSTHQASWECVSSQPLWRPPGPWSKLGARPSGRWPAGRCRSVHRWRRSYCSSATPQCPAACGPCSSPWSPVRQLIQSALRCTAGFIFP